MNIYMSVSYIYIYYKLIHCTCIIYRTCLRHEVLGQIVAIYLVTINIIFVRIMLIKTYRVGTFFMQQISDTKL